MQKLQPVTIFAQYTTPVASTTGQGPQNGAETNACITCLLRDRQCFCPILRTIISPTQRLPFLCFHSSPTCTCVHAVPFSVFFSPSTPFLFISGISTGPPGLSSFLAVSTSTPSSVTSSVCSNCAVHRPSTVALVQSSGHVLSR